MGNALVQLEQIEQMLAAFQTVDDAKKVRDHAAAYQHYAKKAKLCLTVQNRCAQLKLAAEGWLGKWLEQTDRLKGRPAKAFSAKRLSEMGIDYNESYRWRALAKISLADLDSIRRDCDAMCRELTTALVMRQLKARLVQADYLHAARPWEEHWSARPDDKKVYGAINWLYRILTTHVEADEKLDIVVSDRGYLTRYDVQRLLTLLEVGRSTFDRGIAGLRRRQEGRPVLPRGINPEGLLAYIFDPKAA